MPKLAYLAVTAMAGIVIAGAATAAETRVDKVLPVAPVWSGHPVGFCLLTVDDRQYVAFYDADRRMTVASRDLGSDRWEFTRLDETVGWDSHNYITMACDQTGRLHLAGNMHGVPLVYFRTETPHDITTFQRIEKMVGQREKRCTYPKFMRGPEDELIFVYRDGSSGNGDRLWNVYDPGTQTWRRLIDVPLTSGQGKMNAYPFGPVRDAEGVYHMIWVWRDTPDCATNHDLSYARSRDLVHWTDSTGRPLELPITIDTGEVIDPVPAGGGILNSTIRLGFDTQDRPVASYHKFAEDGSTQLYNARLEKDGWRIYQTSDWTGRWEFGGGGSIGTKINFSPVRVDEQGRLVQEFQHFEHGSGMWVLDEETLQPVERLPRPRLLPKEIAGVRSDFPGMSVRVARDSGSSGETDVEYLLRWETLGQNRDRPRPEPWPEPTMLELIKLRTGSGN